MTEADDLIPGPVTGWRLFGGGALVSETPALFARFAPEAIAYFVDPHARDVEHRAWDWVHDLSEPLESACLVDDHDEPVPAAGCGCGYRVVQEFDELAEFLMRKAGDGDHLVLARVETVGTCRESHARLNNRLDDPPSTVRAAAIRVTDLYLSQEVHTNPKYGTPTAWEDAFGQDAEVHIPPTEPTMDLEAWMEWVGGPSAPPVPAVAGGWRFWLARLDEPGEAPLLFGEFEARNRREDFDVIQDSKLLTARCHKAAHLAPAADCTCGWALVPDVLDLGAYVKATYFATGATGGQPLPRPLRDYIAFAYCDALDITRPSASEDDPPGTLRAQTLRIKALYLSTGVDPIFGHPTTYGTPEQWRSGFAPAVVVAPPPPRPMRGGGYEGLGYEQWVEWVAADWRRGNTTPGGRVGTG